MPQLNTLVDKVYIKRSFQFLFSPFYTPSDRFQRYYYFMLDSVLVIPALLLATFVAAEPDRHDLLYLKLL